MDSFVCVKEMEKKNSHVKYFSLMEKIKDSNSEMKISSLLNKEENDEWKI